MAEITLDQFLIRLRSLDEYGGDDSLVGIVRRELIRLGHRAESDAKRNATIAPKVRTGTLRNSIRSRVTVRGQQVELAVGSSVAYARIQELGGTILFRTRTGQVTIRPNRYLGKAMDSVREEAKTSVKKAIADYIGEGKRRG